MKKPKPTSAHEAAIAWRRRHGLTQDQLANLTGYSREAIYWFERGCTSPRGERASKPIKEWIWQRYKNCCAGVDQALRSKKSFNW